jgi:hypothetical protein
MDFKRNGIVISVADQVIEQLVLERLQSQELAAEVATIQPGVLPRIGAEIAELGGVFAGVVRGAEGQSDYYLIVGPEAPSKLEWRAANEWADTVEHLGFADFTIFSRREQAICFGNVPELFQKEWYWSSEQPAAYSNFAWAQFFLYGYQGYYFKDDDYRARAVRRVPIQ